MHTKKLYFICKKKLFSKIRFAVKKKQKNSWDKFSKLLEKFFLSPSKNASHTISAYGKCMDSIFFKKKNISNQFFLSPVCSTVLKKPQKWFNFFSIVFQKCMKFFMTSIFSIYLMYDLDIKPSYCFDFCNESNGIFGLGVVLFLQTNFDFLTSHF